MTKENKPCSETKEIVQQIPKLTWDELYELQPYLRFEPRSNAFVAQVNGKIVVFTAHGCLATPISQLQGDVAPLYDYTTTAKASKLAVGLLYKKGLISWPEFNNMFRYAVGQELLRK